MPSRPRLILLGIGLLCTDVSGFICQHAKWNSGLVRSKNTYPIHYRPLVCVEGFNARDAVDGAILLGFLSIFADGLLTSSINRSTTYYEPEPGSEPNLSQPEDDIYDRVVKLLDGDGFRVDPTRKRLNRAVDGAETMQHD